MNNALIYVFSSIKRLKPLVEGWRMGVSGQSHTGRWVERQLCGSSSSSFSGAVGQIGLYIY